MKMNSVMAGVALAMMSASMMTPPAPPVEARPKVDQRQRKGDKMKKRLKKGKKLFRV